ncbi:MAG: carbon-nitrogen hydrolase family protein [Candidatus Caldarchaeum sp.]
MRKVRVAAVQLTPSNVEKSLEKAVEFIGLARDMKASVACLPEAWFHTTPLSELSEILSKYKTIVEKLSKAAADNKVWVLAGGLYAAGLEGPRVVAPVISSNGEVVGVQEKVHLFRHERTVFKRGERFHLFEINGVKAGILVCHDIVFPEAARSLALKGAEIVFNPSRIVAEGCGPWRTYLEARCLENRLPVVGVNIALPRRYGGRSAIITVRETAVGVGVVETLAEAGDGEQLITAEIELETPAKMRSARLASRVPSAYEELS